ncbi:MAG: valine--tRNA ligase [Pseudomonadota bacterium]
MDKTFDAKTAEARISAEWERRNAFAAGANASSDETFCIVIPPPNVTGSLHMGHALNNTVQDILIRWHRMQGHDTLWQPGTDHAGIATQMVVERKLADEGNIRRQEMGREAFIERVWQQKAESEDVILGQLKRLGASCDWSRTRFTMDEGLSAAVLKVFVQLYNEGLIYKGKRLVNWDPAFETAISDLEVENIDVDGHMWHFKYPLAGGATYEYVEKDEEGNVTLRETRDYISIATTRPETMLGDGAVAVHPSDERYAPIIGQLCEIPVGPKEHRRLIPIITDEYPDPEFGSGAVKITGAHDFNDYAVAKRGNIPCYRLMDTKGAMREDGAPYAEEAAKAQAIIEGAEMTEAEVDAINLVPDQYRGLDRFEARKVVIADITAEGLAVMTMSDDARLGPPKEKKKGEEEEPAPQPVPLVEAKTITQPFGDRSKVVIEPMLTDQWFVDAATLAKPAIEAVKNGTTKFVPEAWEKTYFQWLENIEPWCISRQLWWGHQVPVWYGPDLSELAADDLVPQKPFGIDVENGQSRFETQMFCAGDEGAALDLADDYLSASVTKARGGDDPRIVDGFTVVEDQKAAIELLQKQAQSDVLLYPVWRDPDVLDTWFSSGLWPMSTLGWPEQTPELAKYYKTDVLVTGFDIIFFWVARMMMTALHFMEDDDGKPEVPFHTVYVHALVRDAQGKKMSKSLGNVIDPLELIDEYGADALRFTLTSMAAMGRDIKLDVNRVAGYRNFGTKLWNAARFAEMNGCYATNGRSYGRTTEELRENPPRNMVNRWVIGETVRVSKTVHRALEEFRFNEAAGALYNHIWGTFCDWYLELSKPLLQGEDAAAKSETQATMAWALDQCLLLLHPIMPFITEELWASLSKRDKMLVHGDWPVLSDDMIDPVADGEIGWVVRLIEEIRSVRVQMNVPAGAKIEMVLTGHSPETAMKLLRNAQLIQRLARLSECAVAENAPEGSVTIPMEDCSVNLPLAGVIDVAAEKVRLEKSLGKLDKETKGLQGKLGNEAFLAKAPEHVVDEQRDRLASAEAEAEKLRAALSRLAEIG